MFGPVVVEVRSEGRDAMVLGLEGRGMGGTEWEPVDTALIGTTAEAIAVPGSRKGLKGTGVAPQDVPLPPHSQHWIT